MEMNMHASVGQPMQSHAIASNCSQNRKTMIIPQENSRWSYRAGLIYGVLSGTVMLFLFDVLPRMLR